MRTDCRALSALLAAALVAAGSCSLFGADPFPGDSYELWEGGADSWRAWSAGPPSDLSFFLVGAYYQSAFRADSYRAIGVNAFVGGYPGLSAADLGAFRENRMPIFAEQDDAALSSPDLPIIEGWAHPDEVDCDLDGSGGTYPYSPASIVKSYGEMRKKDKTRPIWINFGPGAACDAYYGRGERTGHPEDYAAYAEGADILSFDIYPMNVYPAAAGSAEWARAYNDAVAQNPWWVGEGVRKLRAASGYRKPVVAILETTNIFGDSRCGVRPAVTVAEAWMAITAGARGIVYFCHTITPFSEAAALGDPGMRAALTALNDRIAELAPVLNMRTVSNGLTVSTEGVPVQTMLKRFGEKSYLFAVATRAGAASATFALRGYGAGSAAVVGEGRSIALSGGAFSDSFAPDYAVHIYEITR